MPPLMCVTILDRYQSQSIEGSRLFDATILARPFRRHLFRCQTFSAQIISAPIPCYLTVHLFRVRVGAWVRVSKKHRILAPKWSCRKVVYPSIDDSSFSDYNWQKPLFNTPLDAFLDFFNDTFVDKIHYESNLYCTQKDKTDNIT